MVVNAAWVVMVTIAGGLWGFLMCSIWNRKIKLLIYNFISQSNYDVIGVERKNVVFVILWPGSEESCFVGRVSQILLVFFPALFYK